MADSTPTNIPGSWRDRIERSWPQASLRTYLVAVILLAIFPLAALMCYQLLSKVRAEQQQIEDGLERSATAFAQAVDGELAASLDALAALARSDGLSRTLRGRTPPRRDWNSVVLMDAQGTVIADTRADPPRPELRQLHADVLRKGLPVVSGMLPATPTAPPEVMLAVPAPREGAPMAVLAARIGASSWNRLAGAASHPEGGFAALYDGSLRPIGVSPGEAAAVPPGVEMHDTPVGVHRGVGADGTAVYAAWRTLAGIGWTVRVGTPAAPIDRNHRRAILTALGAIGASLLLGVLLASVAAGRVVRPLQRLATQGTASLKGRIPVREIDQLRDALHGAARRDEAARAGLQAKAVELQALLRQLREGQDLIELAQEAGRVGFFQHDFAADAMTWTPGLCKLFGLRPPCGPTTLAGWLERIAPDDRGRIAGEIAAARAGRRDSATLAHGVHWPDGRVRWLSSHIQLQYDGEGRALRLTGAAVDMSDQREAEQERAQLTERAIAARQEAEAASRAKDEFLTMLSHELRNPLGAISAAIDVLDTAPPRSEGAIEARGIIERQTRNLGHMLGDLLDVGRAIAGKVQLAQSPVDLATVAARVVQAMKLTGEAARHRLHLDAHAGWVRGDAVRLEQVLGNLVANALKYTPAGGRIDVRVRSQAGTVIAEVQDTGTGIPPELLPHIFELFVQGERPLDRGAGGLGIGLTLVRRLVELHGGQIEAHSCAAGSRFTVRLAQVAAPSLPEGDTLPPSRRRQVLVVDDNEDVLKALQVKLELDGHSVSTAANGIDGLRRLLQLQPEVSIVDIGLPGLTGFEVARHARAAGYAGRMVALSGYGRERDVDSALTAGFDAYLVKPVDRKQLRDSMEAQ